MDASFHDLPADSFPLTVEALDRADRLVWHQVMPEPGALYVPPLADDHGPVRIRITYANGHVDEADPPGY